MNNFNKNDWSILSFNVNAILILEKNLDKIDWRNLSVNENAIHLLEKNQDKINWRLFQYNENMFVIDYNYYKKRMDVYREELMKNVYLFRHNR